jgi:hypothetical protein
MKSKLLPVLILTCIVTYNLNILTYIFSYRSKTRYTDKKIKLYPPRQLLLYNNGMASYNTTLRTIDYCVNHVENMCLHNSMPSSIKNIFFLSKRIRYYDNVINYNFFQYSNFKKKVWNKLNAYIFNNYKDCYAITCPEYHSNNFIIVNNRTVYIPDGFYKFVIDYNNQLLFNIYFKHTNETEYNLESIVDWIKLPWFISIQP